MQKKEQGKSHGKHYGKKHEEKEGQGKEAVYDSAQAIEFINSFFDSSVMPSLKEYVKIPNQSRGYDPEWSSNGLLQQAANNIKKWVDEELKIDGMTCTLWDGETYTDPEGAQQPWAPCLFTKYEGDIPDFTIMFYGHFDKQPPLTDKWTIGGPYTPTEQNGRLYGRGSSDDGYSTYAALTAVKAIIGQGIPCPRIVMLTQGDEETGDHVDHWIDTRREQIGTPNLIICLDSGTLDYDRLWMTRSLRGYLSALMRVDVLTEAVHSGDGTGVIPVPYRVTNKILTRLEDIDTGAINPMFNVDIPANRYNDIYEAVENLGENAIKVYPMYGDTEYIDDSSLQLFLNRTWFPQLAVTGVSGFDEAKIAGNVIVPYMESKLSMRIPPTLDTTTLAQDFTTLLTQNPPYNAHVTLTDVSVGPGWNDKGQREWLDTAIKEASTTYYQNEMLGQCEGGSIPLMGKFYNDYPEADVLVTGVLGPMSNAHGPNEFLEIEYCKKLIQCMAHIIFRASNEASGLQSTYVHKKFPKIRNAPQKLAKCVTKKIEEGKKQWHGKQSYAQGCGHR